MALCVHSPLTATRKKHQDGTLRPRPLKFPQYTLLGTPSYKEEAQSGPHAMYLIWGKGKDESRGGGGQGNDPLSLQSCGK